MCISLKVFDMVIWSSRQQQYLACKMSTQGAFHSLQAKSIGTAGKSWTTTLPWRRILLQGVTSRRANSCNSPGIGSTIADILIPSQRTGNILLPRNFTLLEYRSLQAGSSNHQPAFPNQLPTQRRLWIFRGSRPVVAGQLSGRPYVVTLLRNVVEVFFKPGFLRNKFTNKVCRRHTSLQVNKLEKVTLLQLWMLIRILFGKRQILVTSTIVKDLNHILFLQYKVTNNNHVFLLRNNHIILEYMCHLL